ncbi:MAG: glycosyltransferase [Blastocatellia bacterium]
MDEVIVVDNGSADDTAEIAACAGATVVRQAERGYGAACLAGIAVRQDSTAEIAAILLYLKDICVALN